MQTEVIFVLVAVAACASAETDREQFMRALNAAKEDCAKNKESDYKTFDDAWSGKSAPDTEEGSCFLFCMMEHIGMVKGDKFDEDTLRVLAANRWKSPDDIEKSINVNKGCVEKIGVLKGCSAGGELISCILEENEKVGLKRDP